MNYIKAALAILIAAPLGTMGSGHQELTIEAKANDDRVVVVLYNGSSSSVPIGPLRYDGASNDLWISAAGLTRRSSVHAQPGVQEIAQKSVAKTLAPGHFEGVNIPLSYFRDKYVERGCHTIEFSYGYVRGDEVTKSRLPVLKRVCW